MNAAAMRLLREKGLSLDDVIEVAEALELRADPTAAARKRRQRAKEGETKGECHTVTVTRDKDTLDKKSPQTPERINPRKDPPIVPPPEWSCSEEWSSYEEMRKRIRKPMTDRARQLAIGELAKLRDLGHDPRAVLNQSVLGSYQGIFPLKSDNLARAGPVSAGEIW